MVQAIMILLATPIIAFIIIIIVTKIIVRYAVRPLSKCTCSKFVIRKLVTLRTATILCEEEQQFINAAAYIATDSANVNCTQLWDMYR